MNSEFLIDSNSFIYSSRQIYRFACFPSFWIWLKSEIASKNISIPNCVYDELKKDNDDLSNWIKQNLNSYVFDERQYANVINNYSKVMKYVSTSGFYRSDAISNWAGAGKADPMLIAIAMTFNCKIVTFEEESGNFNRTYNNGVLSNKPKNPNINMKREPKIPDVANYFGVECVDLYQVEEQLNLQI